MRILISYVTRLPLGDNPQWLITTAAGSRYLCSVDCSTYGPGDLVDVSFTGADITSITPVNGEL